MTIATIMPTISIKANKGQQRPINNLKSAQINKRRKKKSLLANASSGLHAARINAASIADTDLAARLLQGGYLFCSQKVRQNSF